MTKPGAGRKSETYMLVENDEFQIPLIIGTKHELANYAGVKSPTIVSASRLGGVVQDKYRVYKVEKEESDL